ncbi:MAG: hypothetical protein IJH65_11200 [Methanobrevibacter sp.]|nr:hypothetical protein [Methanobrevibacter sp.]
MNFTMYVITGIRVRKQAMIQYLQDRNYDFSVIEEIRVPFGLIPGYPTFGSIFVTFTDIDETCSFYYNDKNGHIRKTNCWYSHKKIENDTQKKESPSVMLRPHIGILILKN